MARFPGALLPLALAAAIAAGYAPGLAAPPAFDDVPLLEAPFLKDLVLALRSFASPHDLSRSSLDYAYRPLSELTLALNWAACPSPQALRLGNLLLHLLSGLMVFRIARKAGDGAGMPPAFAWAAALWFSVHPVGAHAVTYLYQRPTVLEALLAFLALALFLEGGGWRGKAWRLAWISALLAALAKETAAILPLLLGLAAWILRAQEDLARPRRWRLAWPFCLPAALVLVQVLRTHAQRRMLTGQGVLEELAGRGSVEHLTIELPALWSYLCVHAWPWPLPFFVEVPAVRPLLAVAACLGLCAAALWILRGPERHRIPRLGLGLVFSSLLLESSVFPIRDAISWHRCYPGLLGSGLVFAWAAGRAPRALGALALAAMAGLSATENARWADLEGLYARDVRSGPRLPQMRYALGSLALDRGDGALAERRLRSSLRLPERRMKTYALLIRTMALQGRADAAGVVAREALALFPGQPLLLVEAIRGCPADVRGAAAEQACASAPVTVELALSLGEALLDDGRADAAARCLENAAARMPRSGRIWEALGVVHVLQKRWREAERDLRQASALSPRSASARFNLGMALEALGELPGAREAYREALRLAPGHAGAGIALARLEERAP